MSSYREIAQQYAQGGLKALLLLNGGAAVALLTQLSSLSFLAKPVVWSMSAWAVGLTACVLAWLFGFAATRHFDDWHEMLDAGVGVEAADDYRVAGNRWQEAATIAAVLSLLMFLTGCLVLAVGYSYQAD